MFSFRSCVLAVCGLSMCTSAMAQVISVSGKVTSGGIPIPFAGVFLKGTAHGTLTDTTGYFRFEVAEPGDYILVASAVGWVTGERAIRLVGGDDFQCQIVLQAEDGTLSEVVVTGTMREMSRLDSPVPVEVYSSKFFLRNPTPSVFEGLQGINGVRPQLNCNVCNTGDIHINGMEGPYTMVLIDGMPVVSGLASVYGLSAIPASLIERVEVVKGPAAALYGSEAMGGLINVITRTPDRTPLFSADVFGTSWGEINADVTGKFRAGSRATSLVGLNTFYYGLPSDHNHDGFTDVTQQERLSVFNKWSIHRRHDRPLTVAGRLVLENRWGGQMHWTEEYRGSDSIYAESIETRRWELFGNYRLPFTSDISFQFSATGHDQNSAYGDTWYIARQYITFGLFSWREKWGRHDVLFGLPVRHTWFDDNTPATVESGTEPAQVNLPSRTWLPGIFVQDEFSLSPSSTLLTGLRYDHHAVHGHIVTPRVNFRWKSDNGNNVVRVGLGSGYRVANIFTEDHAALTGARDVVFLENLMPETSWSLNLQWVHRYPLSEKWFFGWDISAFYTRFGNRIIADYDTDPDKIIYDNLDGFAMSQGGVVNAELRNGEKFAVMVGCTAMDVFSVENGMKQRQLFTENLAGVWSLSYRIAKCNLTIDYSGNVYSPMRLPLLGPLDPRRPESPWWSIQNIQLTKASGERLEIYGGVKNLLNWTPNRGNPFIIARAHDPFDQGVQFDPSGQALVTPDNPYGLTFDPTYVFGPNQGIRFFLGVRYRVG